MSCDATAMGFSRRRVVLAGLLLGAVGAAARAEPFPGNQVLRIFAPTGAGSPPDTIGRIVASALGEAEGWRVVVENRPGALQSLAMADVLKQPADGLSIFPMSLGAIATPALMPEKGLRLETNFAPVVKIASGYTVLVVHPSVPATTLPDFIALLKSQPDKLNYSAPPFGAPGHLKGPAASRRKVLAQYLIKIARLGGYLARTNDPPPGNIVMWRGLSRLTDIGLGAMIGAKICG